MENDSGTFLLPSLPTYGETPFVGPQTSTKPLACETFEIALPQHWTCPSMATTKSLHDSTAWHWRIPFPILRQCLERFSLMKSSTMDSMPLAFIFMASDLSSCLNHNMPFLSGLCLLKLTGENGIEQQRSIWAPPKAAAFPTSPFCAPPRDHHSFFFYNLSTCSTTG